MEAKEINQNIVIDIEPQKDLVLAREIRFDETEGGILLTSEGAKDPNDLARFRVLALGPWVNLGFDGKPPSPVKVGDLICVGPYAGTLVKVGGEKGFKLLGVNEILAIVKEEA